MLLSVVINADTRKGFMEESTQQDGMFSGCRSIDFLTDGIYNKIKFLEGFDKEIILFLDQHEELPEETLNYLRKLVDTLIIRKHNKTFQGVENFAGFNDLNYINALSMARGKYIFHFDQDCAAFTSSTEPIHELIKLLDTYDYISYPSANSPLPVEDKSFDHVWASTRFFACKRETIDISEIMKCQLDYDYCFSKYPANRKCHWLEHILGLTAKYNGKGVYYPPIEYDKWLLFCWENYNKWTLRRLNEQPYNEVKDWVLKCGGIRYPNNVTI